jgi:predicted phage terminase large subunit-like protein
MANQKTKKQPKKQASPKKEQKQRKNNSASSGEINREYLGKTLLDAGFEVWFRYMFRVLEGKPFIMDLIHKDMFNVFDDLYYLRITRECMNIPPRAGKTTICKYWLIYCLTKNPRCNFIYTSFSQMLLSDIAREVAQILEHPIYKELYGNGLLGMEEKEENPIDDFWREYLLQETGKAVYASKRIITAKGGQILFASIGSTITGFGAGIRGAKGFSGALIIDDANKPADIMSETMRDKVRKYYDETLLSRLNDSNVPIFNIQQRLHLGDLSGYLLEQYKFDSIIKPLLEPDGTCNIASQYTPERIKEISFNDTMFQAQYQQSPVAEKGNIIQRDWWIMYDADHTAIDGKLIITADTAYKKTKTADYSCFQVWELLRKEMRLRDMIVGKWEFPELLEKAIQIWRKWTDDSLINPAAFMYIEDKASGISLEQTLIQSGINAICWKPKEYDYPEDKVGRTRELSWDVYRGLVKLKKDDKMSQYLVNEAALFAEDMSHAHDDSCFVAGTKVATIFGNKNIEELKVGDLVITPWGISPITRTTSRMKPVIDNVGLTGTKDHKIYTTHDYSFDNLENVDYSMVSKLTIKELISWQIKSLYCLMAKNTIVTQRQDIMKIKSLLTEKEKHSGFIGLFMNFIQEKKFLKAITFITKTKIKITTTLAIWFFYHTANTLKFIAKELQRFGKGLKCKKQIKEEEKDAKSGTIQKREEIGIQNIKKNTLPNFTLQKYALTAEENLIPLTTTENRQYVDGVEISTLKENYVGKQKKRVYNITVRAGCYYANNILVSNCDAASMAHSIWRYAGGGQ